MSIYEFDHNEVLKFKLKPERFNDGKNTPLHIAAMLGDADLCR